MTSRRPKRIPAEELLIEQGLVTQRSPARQKLIGCLACRWRATESDEDGPKTYGKEIVNCAGLKSGTVAPILNRLKEIGVVKKEREPDKGVELGRPRRQHFKPADSELGKVFAALLEVPTDCNLDSPETTTLEHAFDPSELRNLAASVIALSAREDLEWIITQANHRLGELDSE